MFDELLRQLRHLDGQKVSVTIPPDREGYLDRRCPIERCHFYFKILDEDWRDKVPDDSAYCPFCRHKATDPHDFITPEQLEYAKNVALSRVEAAIDTGLRDSARAFNSQQRASSFITMKMEVTSPSPVQMVFPPPVLDSMRTRIVCEGCGCRFAVIGAAFFCPACGHNSADVTFEQSIGSLRSSITALNQIISTVDADTAAELSRRIVEGGFVALVTAFQRFTEVCYTKLPLYSKEPRRNAFQNLQEGSDLWSAAGGRSYSAIIKPSETTELERLFQQRHLLAHREGIVDADYIRRSGDSSYQIGQRIVVTKESTLRLADLLQQLVAGLRQDLQMKP